jgi:hypothetical protein
VGRQADAPSATSSAAAPNAHRRLPPLPCTSRYRQTPRRS